MNGDNLLLAWSFCDGMSVKRAIKVSWSIPASELCVTIGRQESSFDKIISLKKAWFEKKFDEVKSEGHPWHSLG